MTASSSTGARTRNVAATPISTTPLPIFVHFEDPKVGQMAPREEISCGPAVRIDPFITNFDHNGRQVSRTQLPSFLRRPSPSIHKGQGLRLDKVVVNLDGRLTPGMAYTAVSRVRKMEDLIIDNYFPEKFKPSQDASQEIIRHRDLGESAFEKETKEKKRKKRNERKEKKRKEKKGGRKSKLNC